MKNFSNRKSNKRLKSSTTPIESSDQDRISDLPDSIIEHVLSYLDNEDAFRTSLLSKRWVSLWSSIPSLIFRCKFNFDQEVCNRFVSFVRKTLTKRASSDIRRFSLQVPFKFIRKAQVDAWLRFAVKHKVEYLQLQSTSLNRSYDWPQCLCKNSSVKQLSLQSLWLDKGKLDQFYWTSLKLLCLTDLVFTNDTIRCLLIGSPKIECLKLKDCRLRNHCDWDWTLPLVGNVINASSCTSLQALVLDDVYVTNDKPIHITAPNLLSLSILGWKYHTIFELVELSSLEKAHMDFSMSERSYAEDEKTMKKLVQDLSHVNELTIAVGIWCNQEKSIRKAVHARFPTKSSKNLEIYIISTNWYIIGVSALLFSLPDLEQLTINLMPSDCQKICCGNFKCCGLERSVKCASIQHLKSIEISGFAARSCSVLNNFLQYLLANANVLEKLIIYVEAESFTSATPETLKQLLEIKQKLLSYPRASAKATILFENYQERV